MPRSISFLIMSVILTSSFSARSPTVMPSVKRDLAEFPRGFDSRLRPRSRRSEFLFNVTFIALLVAVQRAQSPSGGGVPSAVPAGLDGGAAPRFRSGRVGAACGCPGQDAVARLVFAEAAGGGSRFCWRNRSCASLLHRLSFLVRRRGCCRGLLFARQGHDRAYRLPWLDEPHAARFRSSDRRSEAEVQESAARGGVAGLGAGFCFYCWRCRSGYWRWRGRYRRRRWCWFR